MAWSDSTVGRIFAFYGTKLDHPWSHTVPLKSQNISLKYIYIWINIIEYETNTLSMKSNLVDLKISV